MFSEFYWNLENDFLVAFRWFLISHSFRRFEEENNKQNYEYYEMFKKWELHGPPTNNRRVTLSQMNVRHSHQCSDEQLWKEIKIIPHLFVDMTVDRHYGYGNLRSFLKEIPEKEGLLVTYLMLMPDVDLKLSVVG